MSWLLKTLPWKQLRPWNGTRGDGRLWVQNRAVSGPAGDTRRACARLSFEALEVDGVISRGTEDQASGQSRVRDETEEPKEEGEGQNVVTETCASWSHLCYFVFQLSNCF